MSISTTYLLNVALHAVILSVFASLALMGFRQARHRSVVAIGGLLAISFLPWLTALRPARPIDAPAPEIQTQDAPALPTWTVMTFPAQQTSAAVPATAPEKFILPEALILFTTIWAAGAGISLFLLTIASLKVRSWRKSLVRPDDSTWQILRFLSPEFPARERFRLSETNASPCVTGFFKPVIVLPRFLLASEKGLRWAVRHEIAHWQAGDSRWMILFTCIRCLHWWNPLVHRLVSNWADAREQLCDLAATGIPDNRADYGEFLIAMACKISKQPPLAVAMAKHRHAGRLKRRIVCLLESGTDAAKPLGKGFIGTGSALVVAGAAFVSVVRIGAEEAKDLSPKITETARAPEPSPSTKPGKAPEPRSAVKWTAGPQLKFTTRMLCTPVKPAVKEGTLLTDQEVQLHMRSLSQKKGVYLMTAPSVTSRSGEQVEIQIIRHVPPREGQKTSKETVPFVGISMTMAGNITGNAVDLKFDADYRFVPGGTDAPLGKEEAMKINPDDIRIVEHSITSRMGPGQTAVSDLGEIEPGKFLHILVTAVPVNSEGETLDAFVNGKPLDLPAGSTVEKGSPDKQDARPFRITSEAKSGKVRLNAVYIDLPRDPKPPANQRYFKKLSPATDDSLNALVKRHQLEKRQLKQVDIPLNRPTVPWPEFPEIRLSAIVSEDMSTFALTNDSENSGTSSVTPMSSGDMVHIDVQSGNPTIERRVYITAVPIK